MYHECQRRSWKEHREVQSLIMSEAEDTSFFRWVPACSHSMQGQDRFLSKEVAETSSYALFQHGSIKVTVTYIGFHFTAVVAQEQKPPYSAVTSRASSCLLKSTCCKQQRGIKSMSQVFFAVSRNYIPPMSKYIAAIFHANATCVFHGHIYSCTRNFIWTTETLHQGTSKLIADVVQGQTWGSHFLEEFPAGEDVLEKVMLVWLFWEPATWESGFFLITGVLFLLLNTLLGSSLFTKESASSERRAVLMVMGLYMLNHCWKAGWGRKRLKSNCN